MKNSNFILVYLAALIIGVILICVNDNPGVYRTMVIAIGILCLVPSAIMLISAFVRRKNPVAHQASRKLLTVVVALAGLAFGIWLLSMPGFFIGAAVYTFGVVLVLVGFAQVVFLYAGKRKALVNNWWYIIPWLVIAGGFVIIFIGPVKLGVYANIVTGALLVVYAVNGLLSSATSGIKNRRIDRAERKAIAEEARQDDSN